MELTMNESRNKEELLRQKRWAAYRRNAFIVLMLAYPVFHFLVMWGFINIDAILLSFRKFITTTVGTKYTSTGWNWVGFENFSFLFEEIAQNPKTKSMFATSFWFLPINLFISMPLTIIVSYFLCRKMPLRGFYRIAFYLPSVIPLIILTLSFSFSLDKNGFISYGLRQFGLLGVNEGVPWNSPDNARLWLYIFCVWSGIGGNILIISGAINRIPPEILESGQIDGISMPREFVSIVIPLIWQTLTILVVFGLMAIIGVAFPILFLFGYAVGDTNTIGLEIYLKAQSKNDQGKASALGMLITAVLAPTIILVRWGMESVFKDIEY